MHALLRLQFVRFLVVGMLNAAFSYAVYAALLFVGVPYALANLGALVLGIIFSFRTQGQFVFANTNNKLILKFSICWLVIYCVNILLITAFMKFGLNAYLAGAVALLPSSITSYFIQKFFVFDRQH